MNQLEKYGLFVICGVVILFLLGGNVIVDMIRGQGNRNSLDSANTTALADLLEAAPGSSARSDKRALTPEELHAQSIKYGVKLVEYYHDLTKSQTNGEIPDLVKLEASLTEQLESEAAFLSTMFPHYSEWSPERRAALLFLSWDVFDQRGRRETAQTEWRELFIVLKDERWRNDDQEFERQEGERRKWRTAAETFGSSVYATDEAPFRARRIRELLEGQQFHSSVIRGRDEHLRDHMNAQEWFKDLSAARQRAMMELSLWNNRDATTMATICFPKCYRALELAVHAEASAKAMTDDQRTVALQLAERYYLEAAHEAGPLGGAINRREPNLTRWFEIAIRDNKVIE